MRTIVNIIESFLIIALIFSIIVDNVLFAFIFAISGILIQEYYWSKS